MTRAYIFYFTGTDGTTTSVTIDTIHQPMMTREQAEQNALRAIIASKGTEYVAGWKTQEVK